MSDIGGTMTLNNCSISGNSAGVGGGLVCEGIASVAMFTLNNCTVSGNSAGTKGGGVINFGTATVGNTIVAGNTATTSILRCLRHSSPPRGYNLIGDISGPAAGLGASRTSDPGVTTPPCLGTQPWAYYGGPTLDHGNAVARQPRRSGAGSPTIPGRPLDRPCRGLARGLGLYDIAAFQTSLVVRSTSGSVDTTAADLTLPGAVSLANQFAGSAITFDPTVFASAQTITLTSGQLELSNTALTTSITGPAKGLTVSGNNASRVFQVDPGVTASISGLTITGGHATGSAFAASAAACLPIKTMSR